MLPRHGQRWLASLALVGGLVLCFLGWGAYQGYQQVRSGQWVALPSSFAPTVSLSQQLQAPALAGGKAAPVLVEFYTNTCRRCQQLTPLLHQWQQQGHLPPPWRFAMVNAELEEERLWVDTLGIEEVPALVLWPNPPQGKPKVLLPPAALPLSVAAVQAWLGPQLTAPEMVRGG